MRHRGGVYIDSLKMMELLEQMKWQFRIEILYGFIQNKAPFFIAFNLLISKENNDKIEYHLLRKIKRDLGRLL